jgi:hypothetical protein
MLPPKITLISPICSSSSGDSPDDVHPDGHLMVPVLLAASSSFDLEKFTLLQIVS